MFSIKNKLRKYLGINEVNKKITSLNHRINYLSTQYKDLVSIGIDVHFKSPHMILIYSKINGGQLKHIDVNFKDLQELLKLVKELKERYNTKVTTYDVPPSMKYFIKYEERDKK